MRRRREPQRIIRPNIHQNAMALAKSARLSNTTSKRVRGGQRNEKAPFAPPEDWYEPSEHPLRHVDYRIVSQPPGKGFQHVVSPNEIAARLSKLPEHMLWPLEVVQLSRMTRKKLSFPCYGMQWGTTLYLYPLEETRIEYFSQPPKPAQFNEARMYGGRWVQEDDMNWQLHWSKSSLKDFYLNNILIHELGHLLDNRNSRYDDREGFAESFAILHGYRPTRIGQRRTVKRRHHST